MLLQEEYETGSTICNTQLFDFVFYGTVRSGSTRSVNAPNEEDAATILSGLEDKNGKHSV